MKKILFTLLLFTGFLHAQTYPVNPSPFGKIAIKNNGVSTSTSKINTQEADGQINYINAADLPVPTTVTNALELKTENSAGAISGFGITNNGNGTVNIASGVALLRIANTPTATLIKYPIPAVTNLALTDNVNNYVLVDYNGGTPAITVTTSPGTINTTTNSLIYVISRVGNTLDYVPLVGQNIDSNAKLRRRFLNSEGLRRASGAVLTGSNRNLIVTSGLYYSGLIEVPTPAFNTSTGSTFTQVYENGSVWVRSTGNTEINNTQYNNAGVLTNIPTNDYRVDYVYILANNPSKLYVILGNTTYANITNARLAPVPANLPSELQAIGTRIGRVIIQRLATTMELSSEFATIYNAGSATLHNDLGGLNAGDFQHLTAIEKNGLLFKTTIAQIRTFTGILPNTNFYTTDLGREGNWYYDASDTTTADNTGTVLVTSDGKRIKRVKNETEEIKSSWFETPTGSADLSLYNRIVSSASKRIVFDIGTFNLQASNVTMPVGITFVMKGGKFVNGIITGSGNVIESELDYEPFNVLFEGTFSPSTKVFYYKTMQDAKAKKHWGGKRIVTGGFWYENDGGGSTYTVITAFEGNLDNSFFNAYWRDTNTAGGAGLYVPIGASNRLFAKYTSKTNDIDLAVFGVRYDALFLNPTDKKYYTTSSYSNLATDNYGAVVAAIGQLRFWSEGQLSRNLIVSKTLIINSTLNLSHGAYNFSLKGSGYGNTSVISSNSNLNAIIENYYSIGDINGLTGFTATFSDIAFRGNGRIANGMVVKNGYEVDALERLEFHDFTNAGLVLYGISSTFKVGTISCFRNKNGVLITSTHPYRLSNNTQNSDGLISLYRVSGDYNTDALITIDCTTQGSSINIQSVKSENNDNSTILIKRSTVEQYISVKNAFTNGDGDFIKIENYVGELPTIELEGIFHNDTNNNDYDINDLKNSKQVKFFKNPSGAFPHLLYTNNSRTYDNGYLVYRDGDKSNLEPTRSFGTTTQRPSNVILGYKYYDTDISKEVLWNGTSWIDSLNNTALTGTPTSQTATAGTNTTQIATMAAINNALNTTVNYIPKKTGVGTLGDSRISESAGLVVIDGDLGVAPLSSGVITGKLFRTATYLVSNLPASPGTNAYATVTDALTPTYLTPVVGGGSVVCPVFWNGAAWVAH